MTPNSLSRHRVTDDWTVHFDGKLYHVTRTTYPDSQQYSTHWEIIAIRNAPNGGQYVQYLRDDSKLKLTIIKFVNQQLDQHALANISPS